MKFILRELAIILLLNCMGDTLWQPIQFWKNRMHGNVLVEECEFTPSGKELANPNRGFYDMFGFVIKEQEEDYETLVSQKIGNDEGVQLILVQINLCRYKNDMLSETALKNIEGIFTGLEAKGKQCIVRFLYDWDGKGIEAEPESIEMILTHMRQLEPVLEEYKNIIFVLQGVFVGNWGEMHGSKYLSREDMRTLINQLVEVTNEQIFLAVRTPAQWRKITQISDVAGSEFAGSTLANRLSLFNDGMMGTEQDTGTYGILSKTKVDYTEAWNREEELEFQSELCKVVPNGGEVIIENPVNDFENAVESLATMHVTYLNSAYDRNVLNKWAETTVSEDGCFDGMDGLSYIERHLGYRLLIKNTDLFYLFWKDTLSVYINLQNVGFAPMYKNPNVYLVIHEENKDISYTYELPDDVRVLAGGNDKEDVLTIHTDIALEDFEEGKYTIYFYMQDLDSGYHIQLANEQEETEWGYLIGEMEVESKE